MNIRPESPADFAAIRVLVAAAFESAAEADLVEAIRSSEHYHAEMALVAEIEGEVVGHVMISGATLRSSSGVERPIVMLAPLAVLPSRQKQGIGSALVRAVTGIADEQGEPLVTVEGSPAYYGRLGFEHSLRHDIEMQLPDWAPSEAAQVMTLTSYKSTFTGQVIYPAAFGDVSD